MKYLILIFIFILPFRLMGDEFSNKMEELSEQILSGIPQTEIKRTVAVTEFEDIGYTSGLGRKITEQLTISLMKSNRFTMIGRSQINEVLKELKLEMSEFFDRRGAQRMGKLVGADALVYGTIDWKPPDCTITAKMVEVETGRIISGGSASFALGRKSPTGAGLRSLVLPGWGQFYTGGKRKGAVIMLGELGLGATVAIIAIQYNATIDYMNEADTETERDYYYDRALLYYQVYNACGWTAIGIWAYSIFDAYISARSYKYTEETGYLFEKDGLRFSLKKDGIGLNLVKHF